MSKQENLVYRTDAVTNFVGGDYLEEEAQAMSKHAAQKTE